jgi:hypothetical protein
MAVCGAHVQINNLCWWCVEACEISKLAENVQIHRFGVETPFLVVYWPKGFTVVASVALVGIDGGAWRCVGGLMVADLLQICRFVPRKHESGINFAR